MDYNSNSFRYDQSVLNILLFNEYNQNFHFYVSEINEFYKIKREVEKEDFNNLTTIGPWINFYFCE